MGEVLPHLDVVPAGVAMVILVMFSSVAVEAGVEAGVRRNGLGEVLGTGHIVVGLALVEVVEAGFVDFF